MKSGLRMIALAAGLGLAATGVQAGEWEGPYAGAFVGYLSFPSLITGVQGGYAFEVADGVYVGPEVDAFYIWNMGEGAASAAVRAGFELSEDVLIYGRAGVFAFTSGSTGWLAGGGAAIAVSDSVSIFAGADRYDCGCVYTVARGGVQLSF